MSDLRDIATLCNEIDHLTKQVDTLTAERNEWRRMYCRGVTKFTPDPKNVAKGLEEAAAKVAKSFGWDCFKEAK
jgi:hypothetical protein